MSQQTCFSKHLPKLTQLLLCSSSGVWLGVSTASIFNTIAGSKQFSLLTM
ncbi:hypothetical protein PLUTE_a3909 [Pseudoalteromonas luteoviolacea DSM 6061]|nr:hypothetical protein [Pseudoalteromonas luteoviolacea DSM 6061]